MIPETNLRDSYKYYKKNSDNPVDVKIYLYIITGFIAFIMKKVFEGFDVQLAGGKSLGTIGVRGRKIVPVIAEDGTIRGLAPDWKSTKELWASNEEAKEKKQIIYYMNEHTNGIRYNLVWWKTGMKIGNKMLYSLIFAKPNKRKLSALIKSGKEYIVN